VQFDESDCGKTNVGAVSSCEETVETVEAVAAAADALAPESVSVGIKAGAGAVGECDFMSLGEWEFGVRGGEADSFIA
jgi:hypothetical protein